MVARYGWRQALFIFGVTAAAVLLPLVFVLMRDRPADIGEVIDGHAAQSLAVRAADPLG